MKPTVYKLILVNGTFYIGSTIDLSRRVKQHRRTKNIDQVLILSTHKQVSEMVEEEQRQIKENIDNPMCVNKNHYATNSKHRTVEKIVKKQLSQEEINNRFRDRIQTKMLSKTSRKNR